MKFTVSTKKDKTAAAQNTVLEITDSDTVSREVLLGLALQTVVIKRQGFWRKNGIPATDSIKIADMAVGVRQAGATMSPDEVLAKAKSDPDFKAKILAQLQQVE